MDNCVSFFDCWNCIYLMKKKKKSQLATIIEWKKRKFLWNFSFSNKLKSKKKTLDEFWARTKEQMKLITNRSCQPKFLHQSFRINFRSSRIVFGNCLINMEIDHHLQSFLFHTHFKPVTFTWKKIRHTWDCYYENKKTYLERKFILAAFINGDIKIFIKAKIKKNGKLKWLGKKWSRESWNSMKDTRVCSRNCKEWFIRIYDTGTKTKKVFCAITKF